MSLHLYRIADEYRSWLDAIESNEGEVTPELDRWLAGIEGDAGDACDAVAGLVRECEREAEANEAEANFFADRARTKRANAARLKEHLRSHLEAMGLDKIQGDVFTVRRQRNAMPKIRFEGLAASLPDEFIKFIPEHFVVNLAAAWSHLKTGGSLPDGFDVTFGEHLRIT